jgi:hypothetical protein
MKSIADRSTANTQAYEYYLRGRSKFHESWGSVATLRSARELFAKAVEIDPGYAKAYTGIADCDVFLWINGDLDISFEELLAISTKALDLAPDMAEAHASRGMALYVAGRAGREVGDFRRFANPRQLMAYLGLVPSEHSSGGSIRRAGITKAGNTITLAPMATSRLWASSVGYRQAPAVGDCRRRRCPST